MRVQVTDVVTREQRINGMHDDGIGPTSDAIDGTNDEMGEPMDITTEDDVTEGQATGGDMVLSDGRTVNEVIAGAPVPTRKAPPLTGRDLMMYRQKHGGKAPPAVEHAQANGGAALSGRDLMMYRSRHGGKRPGEGGSR